MPTSDAQKKATQKYMKEKQKRIPLDMKIEKYKKVKEKAEHQGLGVNTYIKKLIDKDLEK